MKILLEGGRIIDPISDTDLIGNLYIDDGFIANSFDAGDADKIIDCTGFVVSPGLIDIHVHLRVPGQEYKEDVESGTAAAANGGFTAIACQPNTSPPIDQAGTVRQILELAKDASCRVYPIAAVSPGLKHEQLSEIAELKEAGAVGIGDDAFPVDNSGFLRRAMEYCKMLDLPFIAHCEDKDITGDGVMNEGYVSTVLGLKGISRWAENIGTSRNIMLAAATGCHLHVLHVSTKESVEVIRQAKKSGIAVTSETCPQYIALTDEACYGYNTNAKMSPSLRTKDDALALVDGLKDGTIDLIATDHAPHAPHEKDREFSVAPFGMIGLETSLALMITHLVEPGHLTLPELINKMSVEPARMLKVPGGSVQAGQVADVTIIDPKMRWIVDSTEFKSKSRNTVFDGVELTGKSVATIVGGRVIEL